MTSTTTTRVKRAVKSLTPSALTPERLREILPDGHVDEILEGAGIGYWAIEVDAETRVAVIDRYAKLDVEIAYVLADDEGDIVALTRDEVRLAYGRLVDLDQRFVGRRVHGYIIDSYRNRDADGVELGDIDGEAGDVLVQVAAFAEVVYG